MPRFKSGDRVRITAIETVFAGVEGVVEHVKVHPRNIAQHAIHVLCRVNVRKRKRLASTVL